MVLSHVIHAARAWQRYRACVRELSVLSDSELADIGMSRSGILWTAWQVSQDNVAHAHASRLEQRWRNRSMN